MSTSNFQSNRNIQFDHVEPNSDSRIDTSGYGIRYASAPIPTSLKSAVIKSRPTIPAKPVGNRSNLDLPVPNTYNRLMSTSNFQSNRNIQFDHVEPNSGSRIDQAGKASGTGSN